jgi:hypothetical protein
MRVIFAHRRAAGSHGRWLEREKIFTAKDTKAPRQTPRTEESKGSLCSAGLTAKQMRLTPHLLEHVLTEFFRPQFLYGHIGCSIERETDSVLK